MKKVLFMCINMNLGGTEKALLNVISEMDKNEYEVTILMLEEYGELLKEIPHDVKVKYVNEYRELKKYVRMPPQILAKELLKSKQYKKAIGTFVSYSISKMNKDIGVYFKYILKDVKKNEEQYDIAVAYAGPMDFISYFVLNKINATEKYQWIHFDISKIYFNLDFAKKYYKNFNKVFVVSKEGKEKFMSILPELKDKVEVFHNVIPKKLILQKADEGTGFSDEFDGIRILTVGRLSKEKGQDLAIEAAAKLIEDGYKIRWYCIGDGGARAEYEAKVERLNIEKYFLFLGSKTNPYSYMRECDIYVQPSRHEGYCITLSEAKCFNKPILVTGFVGASEQISNYKIGLVVNEGSDSISEGIKHFIDKMLLIKEDN